MAEIFLMTRGHSDHIDKWKTSMKAQFFPMKFKKKLVDKDTGEEMEVESQRNIEAQLRPYQLWGYVVPEEFVQPVCNNLGIPTAETWFNKTPEPGYNEPDKNNSFRSGFGVQGYLTALRLALRAKKLPKLDLTKGYWHNPIYRNHVNVLGIGWRPDEPIKTKMGEHEGI